MAHNWLACSRGSLEVLFLGIVLNSMRRPSSDVFLPWSCDTTWILHRIQHAPSGCGITASFWSYDPQTQLFFFRVKVDEQHWKRVQMIDGSDWQAKWLKMTSRLVDPSVMIFDPTCAWRASIDAWLRRLADEHEECNLWPCQCRNDRRAWDFWMPYFQSNTDKSLKLIKMIKRAKHLNKTWRFATWFASHMNWT